MARMENIKFYIIIPIYNMEKYLSRCVDSVINQTYTNWHMILVNDGSKDKSGMIIDQYVNIDSRISAIHKENGGIASAMRAALENIDGDYIVFIDSDDYVENNMLSVLMKHITEDNADIVQFSMKQVDQNDVIIGEEKSNSETLCGSENILRAYFNRIKMPSLAMRIFRRELFDNIDIVGENVGVDETTIIQLMGNSKRMVCIEDSFYNIYVRSGSVSRSKVSKEFITQYFEQYDFMNQYIQKNFSNLESHMKLKYLKALICIGSRIIKSSEKNLTVLYEINHTYKNVFKEIRHNKVFGAEPIHFKIGAYIYKISPKLYCSIKF